METKKNDFYQMCFLEVFVFDFLKFLVDIMEFVLLHNSVINLAQWQYQAANVLYHKTFHSFPVLKFLIVLQEALQISRDSKFIILC